MRDLRIKDSGANASAFDKLENGTVTFSEIDMLCSLINAEFLMKGILPTYEPNDYGIELEALLDLINQPGVNRPR